MTQILPPEKVGRLLNLTLTGEKHQHIAMCINTTQAMHGLGNPGVQVTAFYLISNLTGSFLLIQRMIFNIDRVTTTGYFNHRGVIEMPGKFFCIYGCGGNDDSQISAAFNQLLYITKQKINVQI